MDVESDTRIGLLLAGDPIEVWRELLPAVRAGEFWGIGIGDSPSLYPDPYVQATVAALEAPGLHVGPWVTNPVTRHPAVTARALHTLDVLAHGRAFLGIGVGDSAVRNLGRRPAPLAVLERYVRTVRGLLAGGEAEFEDLRIPFKEAPRRIPIYVAASGPRGLELAGRTADGVIIGAGLEAEMIARAKEAIASGARSSGRSIEDLDLWWPVVSSIDDDEQRATELIASHLVTYAHFGLTRPTSWHAVPAEVVPGLERIGREYRSAAHAEGGAGSNADLVNEEALLPFLRERFAVSGSPTAVAARIAQLRSRGASGLLLATRVPDKAAFLSRWTDDVLPRLRPHR